MPVVPISVAKRALRSGPVKPTGPNGQTQPPPEPWALMAAAQMHSEGRLVEPTNETEPDGKRLNLRR